MRFQRVGRRCYEYLFACVKRNKIDSALLTCLLKFIKYFPDYLSVLSCTLLSFFLDNLCRNSCIHFKNILCHAYRITKYDLRIVCLRTQV